jgi:hypothetical protein
LIDYSLFSGGRQVRRRSTACSVDRANQGACRLTGKPWLCP